MVILVPQFDVPISDSRLIHTGVSLAQVTELVASAEKAPKQSFSHLMADETETKGASLEVTDGWLANDPDSEEQTQEKAISDATPAPQEEENQIVDPLPLVDEVKAERFGEMGKPQLRTAPGNGRLVPMHSKIKMVAGLHSAKSSPKSPQTPRVPDLPLAAKTRSQAQGPREAETKSPSAHPMTAGVSVGSDREEAHELRIAAGTRPRDVHEVKSSLPPKSKSAEPQTVFQAERPRSQAKTVPSANSTTKSLVEPKEWQSNQHNPVAVSSRKVEERGIASFDDTAAATSQSQKPMQQPSKMVASVIETPNLLQAPGDATKLNVEPLLLPDLPRAALPIQPSTTTVATSQQTPPVTAAQISGQIGVAVTAAPGGAVQIALSPEELGHVRLIMTTTETTVNLIIQAERVETADLLRRHIDILASEFETLGYSKMTFTFSDGDGGREGGKTGSTEDPVDDVAIQSETPQIGPRLISGLDLRI